MEIRMEGTQGPDTPERIRDAAGQFEALLVAHLMRQAREASGGGWMGEGEDQTAGALREMAEEQFAQALAAQGGLGLAKLVADGIKR